MAEHTLSLQLNTLLSDLKKGNNQALSEIYDLAAPKLYGLCYGYFKNKQDAEDALSDVFVLVKRKIHLFNGKNGFNWLYTITKNTCLNMLKKRKRETAVDFTDPAATRVFDGEYDAQLENVGQSHIFKVAKAVLNPHEYRIVIMHAVHQLKFNDIARAEKALETTVRWQYHNSLKKLQKHLKGGNDDE